MITDDRQGDRDVVIADRDPSTRAGLRMALEAGRFAISAEAGDAQEAVASVIGSVPDVCLLDVGLPGGGISAAAKICAQPVGPLVVMLTSHPDDDELLRVVRAGAVGYLRKDMDPGRLPNAIEGVLAGEAAVPRELVPGLIDEIRARGRRRRSSLGVELTSREWDVLDLLEKGAATAEIASALCLSPVTVRRHLSAAVEKLGAGDRETAVSLLRAQA
jgi:DNA-binding NarL/FixJ family response regulator